MNKTYKKWWEGVGSIQDADCDTQTPSLRVWTKFQSLLECDWQVTDYEH